MDCADVGGCVGHIVTLNDMAVCVIGIYAYGPSEYEPWLFTYRYDAVKMADYDEDLNFWDFRKYTPLEEESNDRPKV